LKSNIILQQIGMPFISSIFRNSSTSFKKPFGDDVIVDLSRKESRIKMDDDKANFKKEIETLSLTKSAGNSIRIYIHFFFG